MLIHPFVPFVRAASPCDPAKSAQTVPLPNGSKLPTASISAESSGEIFLRWTGFVTKLGPQIRLSPVLIFGVNIYVFNRFSVVNFMSLWVVWHKIFVVKKCTINNLEWFSFNKIIILPCVVLLFTKECFHVITLTFLFSHFTIKICLKIFVWSCVHVFLFLMKNILCTY
jgi:hypothetical protein